LNLKQPIRSFGWTIVIAASLSMAPTSTTVRLRPENAVLTDVVLCTTEPSVGPYITGFQHDDSRASWATNLPDAGIFDVAVNYRSPHDKKICLVGFGSASFEAPLPKNRNFKPLTIGRVDAVAGPTELSVEKGDGFYDLAEVDLIPSPDKPIAPPAGLPCDPAATIEARSLLKSLCAGFGRSTLSGGYGDAEEKLVLGLTGRRPAIFGADLMDYSPSRLEHGQKPGTPMDDLIRRSRGGQIITLSWHWNAPSGLIDKVVTGKDGKTKDLRWYRGFYTDATTFDIEAALADPASESYRLLLRDIDAIAVPLKQLDDAHVPVLWRPLHEAEGKWFWWGAKGPAPFKKLWRLTCDRLVRVHGLHNLVWVFTDDTDPAWYPGDDVVDVVGIDAYPKNRGDVMAGRWIDLSARYAGRKPIALTECRGVPDVPAMYRLRCPWAYFVSWTAEEGPKRNLPEEVKSVYRDPHVRSLGP
jgi:mannan endo-1,4-beta-mannosidase